MSLFSQTPAAQTRVRLTGSDIRSQADLSEHIRQYYDTSEADLKGQINESALMALFKQQDQTEDIQVEKTTVKGNSVASMGEDGDPFPFLTWGQGWTQSWPTYQYLAATRHQRRLEEISNFGAIAQEIDELRDSGLRTIKYAAADAFNRGVDPSTTAPFLCLDGMGFIDGGRVNPVEGVANWSNLESTGAITEAMLFQASLNAQNILASNGDEMPRDIIKIHIPVAYDQVMWKVIMTPGMQGSMTNDLNWAKGRFKYEMHREFTTNNIFYQLAEGGSRENGLQFRWAIRPGLADINFENPDIMGKRLRFRFGIGCKDPRASWRGGALNALA